MMTFKKLYDHCCKKVGQLEQFYSVEKENIFTLEYEEHLFVKKIIEKIWEYKWHNLEIKNDDLPKNINIVVDGNPIRQKRILCQNRNGNLMVDGYIYYNKVLNCYSCINDTGTMNNVVAWKYIDMFDKGVSYV